MTGFIETLKAITVDKRLNTEHAWPQTVVRYHFASIKNSYSRVDSADTIVYVSVSLEVVVCRLPDYITRDTGLTWWSKPK